MKVNIVSQEAKNECNINTASSIYKVVEEENYFLLRRRWNQQASPNPWSLYANLRGIKSQTNIMTISKTARI
jgi:hypothetical protein